MASRPLHTSAGFFLKYGFFRGATRVLDRDPQNPGIQGRVDIREVQKDFELLPPADRYAVFTELVRCGEREVLKELIGFKGKTSDFTLATLFNPFEKVLEKLGSAVAVSERERDGQTWARRLEVAKAKFELSEWLLLSNQLTLAEQQAAHGWGLSLATLLRLRSEVGDYVRECYHDSVLPDGRKKGDPLWDTDEDLDPYRRQTWDAAFDNEDVD
ncbi:MAG: hypothetical protein HY540_04025, partial [Deltaproteobacteria bacterium]|nr:hypothetical protein [Deltaproteobacteria bacterium]